jgi:hypothetical protein
MRPGPPAKRLIQGTFWSLEQIARDRKTDTVFRRVWDMSGCPINSRTAFFKQRAEVSHHVECETGSLLQ